MNYVLKLFEKKLGINGDDGLYGYFSAHGAHPTFTHFKSRVVHELDGTEIKTARVFVGGTPLEHVRMFHLALSLVVLNLTISKVIRCFTDVLNESEAVTRLKKGADDYREFHEKHFVPWASNNGLDTDEFIKFLKEFAASSDAGYEETRGATNAKNAPIK